MAFAQDTMEANGKVLASNAGKTSMIKVGHQQAQVSVFPQDAKHLSSATYPRGARGS